jgi:hypothetical protein
MNALPDDDVSRSMLRRLAREEAGGVRGIVFFLALLAIATVVVLDVVAVYGAQRAVQGDVGKAARLAVASYLSRASDEAARREAASYLDSNDMRLLDFRLDTSQGVVACTVSGQGSADTFVLKYLARLPKVGGWFKKKIRPKATAATM